MPGDEQPQDPPTSDKKVQLSEPTDRRGSVELGEAIRKGTDPFPTVSVDREQVTPSLSADPPPAPPDED
jgi:hypothetical protein